MKKPRLTIGDLVHVTSGNGPPFEGCVAQPPYRDGFNRWNIVVAHPHAGLCVFSSTMVKKPSKQPTLSGQDANTLALLAQATTLRPDHKEQLLQRLSSSARPIGKSLCGFRQPSEASKAFQDWAASLKSKEP